jgi:predicted RNase H-like HicB family nuclease
LDARLLPADRGGGVGVFDSLSVDLLSACPRAAGYTCCRAAENIRGCYKEIAMRVKVVVHEADEGGLWAEVPAIAGCATDGDTFEELLPNLYAAIEGCLSVDVAHVKTGAHDRVMDIAI